MPNVPRRATTPRTNMTGAQRVVRPGPLASQPMEYQRIQSPAPMSPTTQDFSSPYTPPPYRANSITGQPQSTDTYPSPANGWGVDGVSTPPVVQQDAFGMPVTPQDSAWDSFSHAAGIPAFGSSNMMNDATTQMGMQLGRHVAQVGGEYMQRNFRALLPMPVLKHYFNVSNSYVLHKLRIILFPWRHRPWSRRLRYSTPYGASGIMSPTQSSSTIYAGMSTPERSLSAEGGHPSGCVEPVSYCVPREDVNSPDMYIPLMAFVTYVIATSFIYGIRGRFHPEVLGYTASRALAIVLIEFSAIKLGCYLLNIQGDHTVFDLIAYSGYKFVGTLVILAVGSLHISRWLYWLTFLYMFAANAFFLLRSLRYVVLPDPTSPSSVTVTQGQRAARIQFLFGIAMSQIVFGWLLIVGVN